MPFSEFSTQLPTLFTSANHSRVIFFYWLLFCEVALSGKLVEFFRQIKFQSYILVLYTVFSTVAGARLVKHKVARHGCPLAMDANTSMSRPMSLDMRLVFGTSRADLIETTT